MNIELIPAIDLINGQCVRLTKGDYDQKKVYNDNPVEVAKQFEQLGFKRLHVVDLDGAKSKHIVNDAVLKAITSATALSVDFGGGIKTEEDIEKAFAAGAGGERIPVPPAGGQHLLDARIAYRAVRGDGCSCSDAIGWYDRESSGAVVRDVLLLDRIDLRERREVGQQLRKELLSCIGLDHHAGAVVPDGPAGAGSGCGTIDGGPESDTLDGSADGDPHREAISGSVFIVTFLCPQLHASGMSFAIAGGLVLFTLRIPSGTSRKSARS